MLMRLGKGLFVLVMYLIFLVETKKFSSAVGGIFVLSLLFLWGFQRQNHEVFFTDKTILLVQPNAPQSEKWDENLAPVFFNRMIEKTEQANDVDLIVWPESAILEAGFSLHCPLKVLW